MRASLQKLYIHLSDISIRLARADRPDEVNVSHNKKKEKIGAKDDVRINVAKSLEKIHSEREAYLEALKEKISRGEYQVSAEEVAARILGVIEDA